MNKKEKERNILNLIFDANEHLNINEDECPDFIVENTNDNYMLGVEVTELFADETAARLLNIPYYLRDIIEQQNYKHKDDIEKLQIVNLTSIPDTPDEETIKLKGIMRNDEYTFEKFLVKLCSTINEKDEKHLKYKKGLDAIDLIIYNYDLSFLDNKDDLFFAMFCNEAFRKCLTNTRFREIYFVSRFQKKSEQYIGLKAQHFALMYFWFLDISSSYYGRHFLYVDKIPHYNRLIMFSVYLLKSGFQNVYISAKGVPKLFYSTVSMVIDYQNSPFIKENRTKRINNLNVVQVDTECQLPIDDKFMNFAYEYQKEKIPTLNKPILFDTNRQE